MDGTLAALVAEATKKAGLVWVRPVEGDVRARAVWHVWRADAAGGPAAYVIFGGEEQPPPELGSGPVAVTTPSKDTRARLVTWIAAATPVRPDDPDWAPTVAALAAARLNAADHPTLTDRWAAAVTDPDDPTTVVRLAPTGEVVEHPGAQPDSAHAAPPAPTPATTAKRKPFTLGARNRRADR
ncbi:MAG TPA: hypothetical protein VGL93_00130 [Streptosporangiaceae bacterium]